MGVEDATAAGGARRAARGAPALIVELCVERREVTLSSGKKSDFYLDLRRLLMRPRGLRLAGELTLARLMRGPWVDAVGGMAVGAVPLVAAVLAAAAHHDPAPKLVGFFVRKEAKKHGLGNRLEGAFVARPDRGARRGHDHDRRLDARRARRRDGGGRQGDARALPRRPRRRRAPRPSRRAA